MILRIHGEAIELMKNKGIIRKLDDKEKRTKLVSNILDQINQSDFLHLESLRDASKRDGHIVRDNSAFEKKKWISVTGLCNNNCIFCLDGERRDRFHKKDSEIRVQIEEGIEEGAERLVLSGGEPTVHPDILDFVRYGKEVGYKRIQIISNGRMLAYSRFLDDIVKAGLDETTFSIHGHTARLHESMTRVPGSFKQIVAGMRNALSKNLIVNTDTIITKMNYRYLLDIIKFVHSLGIYEVNLMSIVPFGNSWKYRENVLYDFEKVVPYVHRTIEYCIRNGMNIWLSRFPAKYMEGYERYIDSYRKIHEDVVAMGDFFKREPECMGEKCVYCGISDVCTDMQNALNNKGLKDEEIIEISLNRENIEKLSEIVRKKGVKTVLKFEPPLDKGSNIRLSEAIPRIKDALKDCSNISVSGIPPCMFFPKEFRTVDMPLPKNAEFKKIAEHICMHSTVKRVACEKCILNDGCRGISREYVRKFGFSEIHPVICREIRINMDCNQDCLFCNTDENAENVILDSKEAILKIKEWCREGLNYLIISGKEPTLHPDLEDFIKLAKGLGCKKIEIQTNAVRLSDREYVKKLSDSGLTHAFVSFHSHKKGVYERITQSRKYGDAASGIRNLIKSGIEVTINVVINELNYRQLPEFVRYVKENFIGCNFMVFSFVAPVCSALDNKWVIPRISLVTPYLKKALDSCIKNGIDARIPSRCGIPACFLKGYEDFLDELNESSRWANSADKVKRKECKDCEYNDRCNGLWKEYVNKHGWS